MISEEALWETKKGITFLASEVARRGWSDNALSADRFAQLRLDRRLRDAQIAELYEQYFPPQRHEFEWHILSDIVNAVVSSPLMAFAAGAISGGVLGNAAYDLLKQLSLYAATQLRNALGESASGRASGFEQLANDAEKMRLYFVSSQKARIEQIENATGLPREKVYPLMKVAGMTHHRRGDDACYWELPS